MGGNNWKIGRVRFIALVLKTSGLCEYSQGFKSLSYRQLYSQYLKIKEFMNIEKIYELPFFIGDNYDGSLCAFHIDFEHKLAYIDIFIDVANGEDEYAIALLSWDDFISLIDNNLTFQDMQRYYQSKFFSTLSNKYIDATRFNEYITPHNTMLSLEQCVINIIKKEIP